ncbi:MAG: AAA family ATPase [Myxococcota bacterium]
MTTPEHHAAASESLRQAIREVARGLVEREALVELIALAAVAREHVLVIGPPGTAKSAAVRKLASGFQGRYFEYLLGRFSEPSELFGPVNLKKLRDGVVETETAGMLPEAEIAFLDEVFLGSTAILNTLLGLLNERVFVRGHSRIDCPLRVCVGAANAIPTDENLAAFADRFLVQMFVEPIPDPRLEDLLEAGWALESSPPSSQATVADLDAVSAVAKTVDLAPVRPVLADAIRTLRNAGVTLTDRRCVKIQRLIAAACALDGRTVADGRDLWPMVYAVPGMEGQGLTRDALGEILKDAQNLSLAAAASEASLGPAARADVLVRAAHDLLETEGAPSDARAQRLRLEGWMREIDGLFAPDTLPESLHPWRRRIAEMLEGEPG